VTLVGSDSVLGREVRDLVETGAAAFDLRLLAAERESVGKITAVGGMAAVVFGLDAAGLAGADAILLAGSRDSARKALDLAELEPGIIVVDLTGVAEDRPDARLRAPLIEAESARSSAVQVVAHPAAIALALLLRRLQSAYPIRRAVIQILAPASEYGLPGVEELQVQTVSVLSFKSLPKAVFDAQLAFSLLARYGEEAPISLEHLELTIERHLATLLELSGEGSGAPMPSLRLIQAPVFHGYGFSAWVDFIANPGAPALEESLACGAIEVHGADVEPPNNVGQAGHGGIAVGGVAPDRNQPSACWFWMVADNIHLAAENAVAVVKELL